jgi:hypothetical protein
LPAARGFELHLGPEHATCSNRLILTSELSSFVFLQAQIPFFIAFSFVRGTAQRI